DPHADVRELGRMGILRVKHQREVAEPEDGQAYGSTFVLGMDLGDLRADDFVVEFQRLDDVVDVEEDARDAGRHPHPLLSILKLLVRRENTRKACFLQRKPGIHPRSRPAVLSISRRAKVRTPNWYRSRWGFRT